MKRIIALFVPTLLFLSTQASAAEYRDLCYSNPSACTYTGPTAPRLDADVCLDPLGTIRLKGSTACGPTEWPYYIQFGELLDPVGMTVVAYIPLEDACSKPGVCLDAPAPNNSEEFAMCCTTVNGEEVCVHGGGCGGTLYFCHDGVCNEDGTVTCFESEQL